MGVRRLGVLRWGFRAGRDMMGGGFGVGGGVGCI